MLGVVLWPLGHGRHPFATRGQRLCFRFGYFPIHGEVPAPGVFDLVQRGVGLGEQLGVGLAVTREQADADACRDDIILPEGDMGQFDGEPPAFGFEGFEPIGKGNVLG